MGPHAVLHLDYADEDIAVVTQKHQSLVFPLLKPELSGREQVVLDFGCGAGRFAQPLLELTQARYIGLELTSELLPPRIKDDRLRFEVLANKHRFDLADESIDLLWIYQVLGGIKTVDLSPLAQELDRVLRKGGTVCLVENISAKPDSTYWHYRSVVAYKKLFADCDLELKGQFEEFGESIAILIGHKSGH